MRTLTNTMPLRDLVQDFNTGRIQLPQFQRDYVWKPAKIRNLLDSLYHGYPVGGFYLWQPSGSQFNPRPRASGSIPPVGGGFTGYLIDGQQRLTSLEAAYGLFSAEDKWGLELRCFLDLFARDDEQRRDTRLFVTYGSNRRIADRVDNDDPSLVDIKEFYDGNVAELRQRTEEGLRDVKYSARDMAAALDRFDRATRMLHQLVPCTVVSEVDDSQAVEVFGRLNKGGTPLRQSDVQAAALARGDAVSVLRKMREYVSGERPRRMGIGFSFAFRALVVLHRGTAEFKSLKPDWMETSGHRGSSLAESWKNTEKALENALIFADDKMGWCRRALVPSANALIVLAAAMERSNYQADPEIVQNYRRWLSLVALRGVFQGGVETTMNRFLRELKTVRRGDRALLNALRRSEARRISVDDLNGVSSLWGPATQVLHSFFVSERAQDWLTGDPIDALARVDRSTSPSGELTVHHIFPRVVLSKEFDEASQANRPANFALISRSTNSEFKDRPPDEVLSRLSVPQRQRAEVQLFGSSAGDRLGSGEFEEFCKWRAQRLAQSLNSYLGITT